jgi:hypothetical protein
MTTFVKLMIGEWTLAIATIGFFAVCESGKLLKILKRIAGWLEASAAPVATPKESFQPESEDVV